MPCREHDEAVPERHCAGGLGDRRRLDSELAGTSELAGEDQDGRQHVEGSGQHLERAGLAGQLHVTAG
jgi:hypothetical protein